MLLYIDPGTGSMLFTVLIGLVSGWCGIKHVAHPVVAVWTYFGIRRDIDVFGVSKPECR